MAQVVGYALLPWERTEEAKARPPVETIRQGLREIAEAGFNAFEALTRTTLTNDYGRRVMRYERWSSPPQTFSDSDLMSRLATLLRMGEEAGLRLTTIFCDGEYVNPEIAQAEFDQAAIVSRILAASGAKHLLVAGGPSPTRPGADHGADLRQLAARLSEIGREVAKSGVTLCFHPHIDTCVETPHDIDVFFGAADPDAVAMALDTAHVLAGGGDPVRVLRDHGDRVKYLHIKDIAMPAVPGPDFVGAARYRAFCDLGAGSVDFAEIGHVLRERPFEGPVVAELDFSDDPKRSARVARQYLRDAIGV